MESPACSNAERDEALDTAEQTTPTDSFQDTDEVVSFRISCSLVSTNEPAQKEKLGVEPNAKHQAGEHAATSTVRDRVLGLNEILTEILVHLPPKKIFEVQRVSKSFLSAIQKSPEIREKLFLRQRKRIKNMPAERRGIEHAKLTTNPLLLREGW